MRKTKMFKKCLVYTLISALTLSNVTPALAYDHLDKVDYDSNKNSIAEVHEEVNVTEDGTSQATVYAELGKEFTITVPKSLTLSGQTKSGTYTVSVEGDIAGTDKINVIPDETFTLNSSGLNGITASINQDKTSWGYNEILTDSKVIGNGEINASNLSAGKWNGTFNFNINLKESAGSEEDSKIEVSFDDETTQEVTMGANDSVQIDVFLGEDNVNDQATWSSDNENITVNNGLVKATEAAKNGETANITATIGDKTITVKITVTKQEESPLTLSVDDEVAIGAEESLQVNAYLEGELANDLVDWNSNNENITVTNGLIETKASAQIGDSATITVTAENPDTLSAMANTLNDLGIATVAMAEDDISIEFTVTIVDIEYSVDEINLKPGESMDVTAKIIPEEINGTVRWSQTAVSGLNLVKNGNTVTIKVAENMETGKSYNIVATYGDYSKTLTINIISDHEHNYKWEITTEPTCMEDGIKTYTCDCGDSYEEIIYASDEYHDYESEYKTVLEPTCTEVGYKVQYCSICTYALDEIELPATGHNYIETVTDATCTANGNKHYECDVCGDSYDETITSNGHTYEEGNYTIDKAATCEEAGSKSVHCEVCNAIIEGTSVEIEATGHNYPSFWTTEKEATCLEAGLEQRICVNDNCGKIETREVKATGHTEVIDAAVGATCTKAGLTEGKHCSVCNEILVAQEEIPAGHNYENGTCTKCGETDPDYVLEAGLYDANGTMLCSWEESGIDIEESITSGTYSTTKTSAYYIIKNKYPTTSKIVVSDKVTKIGECAFYKCYNLTEIILPDSVTSIDSFVFNYCTNLTHIIIPDSITSFGKGNFISCTNLTSIGEVGSGASVEIPNTITSIGDKTFLDCTGITSVTIPSYISDIGIEAFSGCTNIKDLTISEGVINVGEGAFAKCTSLTNVLIPNSMTKIGYSMFAGCTGLTSIGEVGSGASVEIPPTVTTIGASAFNNCSNLVDVTIPDSITTIERAAFQRCTSLTTFYIPKTVTKIITSSTGNHHVSYAPFYKCSDNLKIYCGASSRPSGYEKYAFYYGTSKYYTETYGITREDYIENYK